jgi:hypothetical protein
MSGTIYAPTLCHISDDMSLQCLCCSQTKEQHVCDEVCCVGKLYVDGLRPRRRVVHVSVVSAWPACNGQRIQKREFWFPDWLVNSQDLYCLHNRSWGCKFFFIWQSKLDFYSSAKILSLVTFMPLRCVTECAMIKGRCASWLCHVGWQVYSDIVEGHAFCIFRVKIYWL